MLGASGTVINLSVTEILNSVVPGLEHSAESYAFGIAFGSATGPIIGSAAGKIPAGFGTKFGQGLIQVNGEMLGIGLGMAVPSSP